MLVSSPISDFLVYHAATKRPKYQLASKSARVLTSAESIALLEERKKEEEEEEKRRRKL